MSGSGIIGLESNEALLRGQMGCHTGKGEKLSINQAEPGQAITSAVV